MVVDSQRAVMVGAWVVVAGASMAACDGGGDATPDATVQVDAAADATPAVDGRQGFWLSGAVRAHSGTIPADGKLVALWAVSDDEPRTGMHKWGEALQSGPTFEMPFPVPPADARIVPELAVALLARFAPDAVLPADGDIEDEGLPEPQGVSIGHALFHRTGTTGEAWADEFPLGFSCGRCVQNADDNENDHYVPAPCGEFEVVTNLPDDARSCNWR